ncbi:MAG TPA: hypothetical protein VGH16_13095 [Candidatus Binatia bacterium]|jgi:hypothetical protein
MKYEVRKSEERDGAYAAVAVSEGDERAETPCAVSIGAEAQQRAQDYAEWQNSQLAVTGEQLLRR